ncbi:MAG: tetratricopeptide repeat protein [Kofleriaceae bacterium]
MFLRRLPLVVVAWLALSLGATAAVAGPRADIQKRLAAAMESYDLLEYETARKLLLSALEISRDAKLEDDPLMARVHLSLGIVYFAGLGDKAAARRAFIDAVTVDPKVALDAAYKTPDMSTLLETVRATTASSREPERGPDRRSEGALDCDAIAGLHHAKVTRARPRASQRLTVSVGSDVGATKVSLYVRGVRSPEFQEIRMARDGACGYAATIAGGAMVGDRIDYYIAVRDSGGTVVASSGSAGAPNVIDLGGGTGSAPVAAEPPEGDPEPTTDETHDPEASVRKRARPRGRRKLLLGLGAASGIGYVTGETEQQRNKVQCCLAPGLLTLALEVGYATSPRLALLVAARLGFPIGANLEGHSPLGPAGFLRARYALSSGASGFSVMGELGGGFIRNTVKLRDGAVEGMDTDIVALGPLLAGAGVGYRAALGDAVALTFDVTAIVGIPVVGEWGTSKLNFGIQLDGIVGAAMQF